MRISAKARYGLSTMISIAQNYNTGEYITIISIAQKLNISKIYLEQVFSLLKRAGLVLSIKGAHGGYQLSREPKSITAYEILSAIESALFEETEDTVTESASAIENAMRKSVFDKLDKCIKETLSEVTLEDLVIKAQSFEDGYMYYL